MVANNSIEVALQEKILAAPHQHLTFADYMDWVLYDPDYGYYSTGKVEIGQRGDFFTSSSLGPDFGELLAEQFREMWLNLGQPEHFDLVEMGAGTGILACDILTYLQKKYPDFYQVLQYRIIEKSIALIQCQQENLKSFKEQVLWSLWENIENASLIGCCFSNELIDAFPVHLVSLQKGELQEIYVTLNEGKLQEAISSLSTPALQDYFNFNQIDFTSAHYPPGYRTEVNLLALEWLKSIANKLKQGYLLTIDYGYTAEKYYHPQRYQGTLQCYYQHRYHGNPYVNLGQQDITAHVNFTALEKWGDSLQLETLGFTPQGLFLMNLGLGDRLSELSIGRYDVQTLFKRREALHQLINPSGLGKFGVLIQGKALSDEQKILSGLKHV